jgi:uncharacterized membrane protein YjgN (DUF898 family)
MIEQGKTEAETTAAASDIMRFLGCDRDYWRLLVRGGVLLMLTLGIYRFWLATDIRRFLWANTEVAGESLEYTGTAIELLLGFMIALALLVPLYAGFFLAALDVGLFGKLFSSALGFLLLASLGQYAVYRARRYRLTRTVYRGIRLHQDGSAVHYALLAIFCWAVIAVSLGLAYPWALAKLERFKLSNTYFGNLAGEFEGSGLSLFMRGFPMWLLVIVPFVAGMIAAAYAIDHWSALLEALGQGGSDTAARVEASNPRYGYALIFAIMACGWAVLAAAALYPAFQALVLRWWMSGLRVGGVAMESRLRTGDVFRAYFQFLLYGLLFAAAIGIIGSVLLAFVGAAVESQTSAEIVVPAILLVGYVVTALGFSTIYQGTVKLSLWRLSVQSLDLSGLAALDHVKASGKPASPLGEGLADALHVGGI